MANNIFKSLFSDGDSDNQEEYYDEQTPVPQGDNSDFMRMLNKLLINY